MYRRIVSLVGLLLASVSVWGQALTDAKCISMMGVPLEGPDSVFLPALEAAGFRQCEHKRGR